MDRDISQPVQAWAPSDQIHMGEDCPDDGREWTAIRLHDDFEKIVDALEDPELVAEEMEKAEAAAAAEAEDE